PVRSPPRFYRPLPATRGRSRPAGPPRPRPHFSCGLKNWGAFFPRQFFFSLGLNRPRWNPDRFSRADRFPKGKRPARGRKGVPFEAAGRRHGERILRNGSPRKTGGPRWMREARVLSVRARRASPPAPRWIGGAACGGGGGGGWGGGRGGRRLQRLGGSEGRGGQGLGSVLEPLQHLAQIPQLAHVGEPHHQDLENHLGKFASRQVFHAPVKKMKAQIQGPQRDAFGLPNHLAALRFSELPKGL